MLPAVQAWRFYRQPALCLCWPKQRRKLFPAVVFRFLCSATCYRAGFQFITFGGITMGKVRPTISFVVSATESYANLHHCTIFWSVPKPETIAKSLQWFILTFPPENQIPIIVTVILAAGDILVQDSIGREFHVNHHLGSLKAVKTLASAIRSALSQRSISKRAFDASPASCLVQALEQEVKKCPKK